MYLLTLFPYNNLLYAHLITNKIFRNLVNYSFCGIAKQMLKGMIDTIS